MVRKGTGVMVKVVVTDHAVLRYIERQFNLPVEKLREEIEAKALPAAIIGASFFQVGNLRFCLKPDSHNQGVVSVKTVLERWMRPDNKGAKKNRQKKDQNHD